MRKLNLYSHPLHGFEPNEVDDDATIASGAVNGVKNAAIRKLDHELGITDIVPSDFKYLTRLHYWAADVVTHGKSSCWGEHEIDYILFVQKNVKVNPNPEEVLLSFSKTPIRNSFAHVMYVRMYVFRFLL